MNLKSPLLLFLLLSVCSSVLLAQRGRSTTTYSIVGKIFDGANDVPLQYATVALLQAQDSAVVGGTTTDEKGFFELEAKGGEYLIAATFLGFEKRFISAGKVDEMHPFVNLKTIRLEVKATTLDEVEIQAEKSRMEFALDKRVFNVGQDLANNGGNAADLLDNIPSVTVDIDGNVAVRGNSGVRILINGKPSGFANINPADALKQMSANMIEKVEIITNPSARYEAEGTAGVLNIVLKEERRKGWNGTFDLGGGWPARHNATINLNHRRDKFNFFGSAGIRYRNTPRLSFEDREVWEGVRGDSTTEILRQEYLGYRGGISGNLRLGAEYQFGKYASLTGSFFYRKSDDFNTGNIDYLAYDYRETLLGVNIRDTEEAEDDESLDYNLNFERKFARKGQKFSANMVFTSGGETEAMDAVEQALDAQRQPKGLPDLQQQIRNSEWQWELTLMADYVHPFHKEGKFEAGYRSGIRNIDTEYRVEELDPELNIWETLPNLTNEFAYDEQIHAIYTSIGDKFDKFSYQVGLRGEYTRIQTLLRTTNEVNDRTFANLFPSAFLSYEFSAGNAIQLSYSRRTRRPRFWDLNPFFTFSNPISQRTGNPNLNPEFTHSIETSYLKYWDKATLSTSIYYRHTEGEITRITRVDSLGIGISRPENVATRDDIGAEFCLNVSPIKDWDITWSGNVFRGQINGANIGFARQTTFFSFTSRLNSRVKLPGDFNLQVMVNYRGPENSPQGKRRSILYTDVGLAKDFWNDNATVSLRVTDIFNTTWYRYEAFGDDFFLTREGQWRARRQGYLTFTYRLNQKKQRGRGRRGGGGGFDMGGDM